MAQILQGAGGTPVLDEDMLEKMRASGKAYAVEGKDPRIIEAGSVGNATIPMTQYITGTGPEIDLGYTYEPYIPEDKIADIMAEQEGEGEGSSDDNISISDPKPGDPGYEEFMMYNAGPDGNPHDNPKSFQEMMSDGSYMKATNFYEKYKMFPIANLAYKMNMNKLAKEGLIDTGSVPNITNAAENDAAVAAMDKYGGYTGGPSEGYGDGGPGPGSGTGAEGYGGASYGGHGEISGLNYGGKVKKYGYGGPVAEQEDPYAAMPVAKAAPMAPLQGALKANQVNTQREKPWYQEVGMGVAAGAAGNALSAGAKMGLSALGLPAWAALFANKGGMVCPCGTPGCSGCGKGYNHGGPISAGGYKQKIAMAESAAKIKRENMKAYADVYKKMKGPLQQGE